MTNDQGHVSEETDEPVAWEPSEEKRTWAGDITIDVLAGEAILAFRITTEQEFRLRIPRAKLEGMIRELDWAWHRLQPWPANYPASGKRAEGE